MEIAIVGAAMPFGPDTLKHKSIGGSEQAQLMLGKELKKLGHLVIQFTNLPAQGEPDHIESGTVGEDGVRYLSMEHYQNFITSTDVDLLICSRQPDLLTVNHQAKKAVLWMHDLATYRFAAPRIAALSWNFNEIWCVSEFHKKQVNEITGYPLDRIEVVRNGIVPVDYPDEFERRQHQLVYAARPERGLINLVRPGGIMERLPEYNLKVCMYDNHPEHMRDLYQYLFSRCMELPNVELLGSLRQEEVRKLLQQSKAYIYPTQFEETSCILAREALSTGTVFLTTKVGALPETLRDDAFYFEDFQGFPTDAQPGNDEWCDQFAKFVSAALREEKGVVARSVSGANRNDLYWDGVARTVEGFADAEDPKPFSRAWSLIEDSDVYAAKAFIEQQLNVFGEDLDAGQVSALLDVEADLKRLYPFIYGHETYDSYYERYFQWIDENEKTGRDDPLSRPPRPDARFDAIANEVSKLPAGSKVLDYGCAEGPILLRLAKMFPDKRFFGVDFATSNIELVHQYANQHNLENVDAYFGSSENWPEAFAGGYFDAAICSEVLEHVAEPWVLADFVESQVKPGGRIIITVPAGAWEAIGLHDIKHYPWRAHVWHIDKFMLRTMFNGKENRELMRLSSGFTRDSRAIGHTFFCYDADHKDIPSVDPLVKAYEHKPRQTIGACIIAKDCASTIRKTLKSLEHQVQVIQIALEESSDDTRETIMDFALDHPWIYVEIIDRPAIKPREYGFDDARNASIKNCPTDWILWIDTDEFITGDRLCFYAKDNACDSYAIHQHHFSVEPRGAQNQMDRPARMFRNNGKFTFYGKVHEHAELGPNGGPGYSSLLPDVDIAHIGYEDEQTRMRRFFRNFPFLEWDREVNPDRKLGNYLWLRDMIHRMRNFHSQGNIPAAQQMAFEAIEYYEKIWEDLERFGEGVHISLAYYGEAMRYLDRGMPVNAMFDLDGNKITLTSQVEDMKIVTRVVDSLVNKELEKKKSKYW